MIKMTPGARALARAFVALTLMATAAGCGGSGTAAPPKVTLRSIALAPASPSIVVGATQQFVATGTFSDNSSHDLGAAATWTSGTPATATISATGLATA